MTHGGAANFFGGQDPFDLWGLCMTLTVRYLKYEILSCFFILQ